MKQCPECGDPKSIVESTIAKAGELKERPAVEQVFVCASCNAVFGNLEIVRLATPKESGSAIIEACRLLDRVGIAREFMQSCRHWWVEPNDFAPFHSLAGGFLAHWAKNGEFGPTYGSRHLEKLESKFEEFLAVRKEQSKQGEPKQ